MSEIHTTGKKIGTLFTNIITNNFVVVLKEIFKGRGQPLMVMCKISKIKTALT
jgi:hypothetical protein